MNKKKPSTAALSWKFKSETFEFLFDVWNVDRAKQIIKDKPRPIQELDLEPLKALVGSPPEPGKPKILVFGVRINWTKAMSDDVNLDDPILMAYGHKKFIPIDGWHRIAKALWKGLKTLPAMKLTKEESKQVHQYTGRTRPARRRRRR
jgi:hypothetical protein